MFKLVQLEVKFNMIKYNILVFWFQIYYYVSQYEVVFLVFGDSLEIYYSLFKFVCIIEVMWDFFLVNCIIIDNNMDIFKICCIIIYK